MKCRMDIELNWIERGSGMPLVLLHGNGESLESFRHQIGYFSKSYRVIAVDTRGHGRSERGSAPFTLKQFAKDLKALLDSRGIRRVYLLGFSDGGNIALIFTLKYPDYVERLILNGANLYPLGMKLSVFVPIALAYAGAAVRATGHGMPVAACAAGAGINAASAPAIPSPKREKALKEKELLGLMLKEPRIRPGRLQRIVCPTLVIAGTRDMIRTRHTCLIAERIPGARLVLLPGDHFIACKRSREFNRVVKCFLEEVQERGMDAGVPVSGRQGGAE